MTEEVMDTAAAPATPAPDTAAPSTPTPDTAPVSETPSEPALRAPLSEESSTEVEFNLPDEYKDKPWAEKVKSQDDAYKQIDNLTALVGKKTIAPIDYTTATPEEIAAYHSSLAPESASDYVFSEGADPDVVKEIGEAFQEYGINKYQADGLSAKISEISAKIVEEQTKADTSEEAYMKMMEESFGENYKETVGIVEKSLKEHTASDDDKKIFDAMDNAPRAAVDRTVHSITKAYEERIANILKEHGVTESGSQVEGDKGVNSGIDITEVRADLRNKLTEISQRSHTTEEVQVLKNKLAATYK